MLTSIVLWLLYKSPRFSTLNSILFYPNGIITYDRGLTKPVFFNKSLNMSAFPIIPNLYCRSKQKNY